MTKFDVRCRAPCGHVASLTFDALRLPDDTVFVDIPKRRRLRCAKCGRVATEVSPDWREVVAFGNGRRPTCSWILVTRDADGTEGRSSPQWSEAAAVSLARRLIQDGITVIRIEGPAGDLSPAQIEAWPERSPGG